MQIYVETLPYGSEDSEPHLLMHIETNIYTEQEQKSVCVVYKGDVSPMYKTRVGYAEGSGELISKDFYAKGKFTEGRITQGIIARVHYKIISKRGVATQHQQIMVYVGEFDNKLQLTGPNCHMYDVSGHRITIGDFIHGQPVNVCEYNLDGWLLAKSFRMKGAYEGELIEYTTVSQTYVSVLVSMYKGGKLERYISRQIITREEYDAKSINPAVPKSRFDPDNVIDEYTKELAKTVMKDADLVCLDAQDLIMNYLA